MANTRFCRCMRFGQGSLCLTMTCKFVCATRIEWPISVNTWIPYYSYSVAIVCNLTSNWMVRRLIVAKSMRTQTAFGFELMKWGIRWAEPEKGVGDKKWTKLIRRSIWQFNWQMCHCICFYRHQVRRGASMREQWIVPVMCSSLSHFTQNSFSQTTEFCMQIKRLFWNKCVLPVPHFSPLFLYFCSFLVFFWNERVYLLVYLQLQDAPFT